MEVPRRHARTDAITCDTVLPANRTNEGRKDGPRGVARVVSDVSVLCPRAVVYFGNAFFGNLAAPATSRVTGHFGCSNVRRRTPRTNTFAAIFLCRFWQRTLQSGRADSPL